MPDSSDAGPNMSPSGEVPNDTVDTFIPVRPSSR